MSARSVDVVVVTANTRDLVCECLTQLVDAEIDRVVVVDNASSDGTAQAVAERFAHVDVLALAQPAGFAAANNAGAARGHADYVLFLNSDALADRGAIALLARALRERPQAVAAGGRLMEPDGVTTQHRYGPRRFMTFGWFAADVTGLARVWPANPVTRRFVEPVDDSAQRSVQHVAGACMLVRRSAFEAVGGFDERYWFWYEDVDLGIRLAPLGQTVWVPGATFRHLGAASFRLWPRPLTVRSRYHGTLRYSATHLSRPGQVGVALFVVAISLPRIVAFHRSRPAEARAYRAVVAAALALLRGAPVPALAPGGPGERASG